MGQSGFYAVSDNMVLERPAVNQRGGNMGASDSISRSMPRWNEHKLAQLAAEVDDPDFQRRSSRLDQWRELSRQAAQERNCEVPFPDQIEWLVLRPMCWSFVFLENCFELPVKAALHYWIGSVVHCAKLMPYILRGE